MDYPLNKEVLQIEPSGIRRFFDIAQEVEGVISLGVGEPDFDTPWHIREEAIYHLRRAHTFYTANAGLLELREEISKYIEKKTGLHYDPKEEMFVTIGASEAIDLALRCMLNPGDEVLYCQPSYVSYNPCIRLAKATPVPIALKAENEFILTPEALEEKITDNTKVLFINFPNNPTGAIMEKEDLEALVPIIKKHNLIVLSDEIYEELLYTEKPHVSIASLPGMKERTVYINGFSKAYAMTGWRIGYITGPEILIKQMLKVHQHCIMCAPTISQYAALEALQSGIPDSQNMCESYDERRRYVLHRFRKMGLQCFTPRGAFYSFPSIREFGLSSSDFCLKLVEEEKVAVVPGSAFGPAGEGHVRISYAYSLEELREALDRLEKFVLRLRNA